MDFSQLTVEEYTTPCPIVVECEATVAEARALMDENSIRHLPVVSDGAVIGIVSDRDLNMIYGFQMETKVRVENIMHECPFAVHRSSLLLDVAFELSSRKIGSAIVTDDNGKLDGIFTTTDALNALIEILHPKGGSLSNFAD
jgi:acetoin utilization protein AcuB